MTVDRTVHQLDHIAVAGLGITAFACVIVINDRIIAADILIMSGIDNIVISEPAVDSIAIMPIIFNSIIAVACGYRDIEALIDDRVVAVRTADNRVRRRIADGRAVSFQSAAGNVERGVGINESDGTRANRHHQIIIGDQSPVF